MGKAVKAIVGIAITAVGFVTGNAALFLAGLSITQSGLKQALGPSVRSTLTPFDPKSINPDSASPRKLVFGQTTFPVDLRYAEPSGTNQEFIDYIFALAAHKSDAIDQIYIEDDLAWTVGGGAQGKYVGYLTIEVILEAGSGAYHTVNAGTIWGSSTRMTGCTTMKVRVKRSDNSKSSQSPFSSGINGRWAVIGRGIPVYDPAQDSTVAGGSGSQRAATQTTWAYTAGAARGNNPALQLLTYLLGWRIGGVVSVGCGLPVDTIDLPSFATAAALCDESVALAAGGSQRRYEAGRAFADSDDPLAVIRTLLDAMNGELVDDGGRLSLRLAVNDLTAAYTLTDDDFVSGYSWKPAAPIEQQYTVVRGRYSAPGATLYGLVDYPEVAIARTSLAPRPLTLELSAVQEPRRAERIAKQAAVRNLYQGTFSVTLGVRGWLLRRNMVVAVTSSARGWTAKLFRVRSLGFNDDATVDVVLREENAAIYAWSASESAQVTPVAPVVFDSRKAASWLMSDIAAGSTVGAVAGTNLLDSGGRTLTDGEISNTSQRVAVRQWAFNNQSLNGWSGVTFGGTAPTVTAGEQFATFTANSSDCALFSPDMLDVDGRVGRYLRMILSATATLSAGMRNVEVYFSTNAYAPIDGTRSKNGDWIPANHPTNGTPFEVLLDMHSLTSGGNAWRDEIVRRVRIDFDGTIPETIRIHEISMVYLGTATVGAPSGTPVGAYADSASIAPAVASAATTAQWPSVTGTGRPADYADVTRTVLPALQRGAWSASSVAYALGDIVTRDGSSYTVIIAHTSTGANGPPSANWALLANAGATGANGAAGATGATGAQGPTGVSAPPIKSLSTGAAQLDPIRLVSGQTVTAAAELYLNTGGVAGVCSLELQISVAGAGSWATMTSGTVTGSQPTSEPVELVITGATFTNSGANRLFDIRAVSTRQSRSVNVPPSFVRVV